MKTNSLLVLGVALCTTSIFAQTNAEQQTFQIREGERAVVIRLYETIGTGTVVNSGDRVDLWATYRVPRAGRDETGMIMQNVLVTAVTKERTDSSGSVVENGQLMLVVKADQTALIAAAERSGTLRVLPHGTTNVSFRIIASAPPVGDFLQPGEFQLLSEPAASTSSLSRTNWSNIPPDVLEKLGVKTNSAQPATGNQP